MSSIKSKNRHPSILSLPNPPEADVTELQTVFQTTTFPMSLPKQTPILTGQMVFSGASHHQADWERHPLRKNIYAQQQCLVEKQKAKGDFSIVLLYNSQMLYTGVFRKTTHIGSFRKNMMIQKYNT